MVETLRFLVDAFDSETFFAQGNHSPIDWFFSPLLCTSRSGCLYMCKRYPFPLFFYFLTWNLELFRHINWQCGFFWFPYILLFIKLCLEVLFVINKTISMLFKNSWKCLSERGIEKEKEREIIACCTGSLFNRWFRGGYCACAPYNKQSTCYIALLYCNTSNSCNLSNIPSHWKRCPLLL